MCALVFVWFFSPDHHHHWQHNSSVHTLNMSDNRLGSTGAAFITDALRENRSLTDLVIRHAHIHMHTSTCTHPCTEAQGLKERNGKNEADSDCVSERVGLFSCVRVCVRACGCMHRLTNLDEKHFVQSRIVFSGHCKQQITVKSKRSFQNLSHNAIATEGVRLVTETLLSNTSIVRVNLAGERGFFQFFSNSLRTTKTKQIKDHKAPDRPGDCYEMVTGDCTT